MAKRLFDLIVAACSLVLLAPLLIALALWIRLDSPGPALFRQERIGRHGVPFSIHKFRTMRNDGAHGGLPITPHGDARITRAGARLRARHWDELPQLLDVLRGTMSLVGPRPELARYVALYPPELRAIVLSVRPGLTDPSSLAFRDEGERLARAADPECEYVEVLLPAKLRHAAAYLERATFRSDLQCLAATLKLLWRGR